MKENPYSRLLRESRQYISEVLDRRRTLMWRYPTARLHEGWALHELRQRVAAAEQLGHSVELRSVDAGLEVYYVAPKPCAPDWYYS